MPTARCSTSLGKPRPSHWRYRQRRGLFTWKEWAATLGDEIKKAQAAGDPDTGETYYHHWLATLERIVAGKGLSDSRPLARTATPGSTPASARRMARRSS